MEQQVAHHSARPTGDLPVYDDIIIGAGGAGMHLLYAMLQKGYLADREVLVVEPVEKNSNDRTWCFWAKEQDLVVQQFGHLATKTWGFQWSGKALQSMKPYQYYHIRSADFYAYIRQKLSENAQVTWIQQSVESLEASHDVFAVSTKEKIFYAKRVFDSRLTKSQIDTLQNNQLLWQSFTGWRVQFATPLPHPHAFKLMDFEVPQQGATQFMYVLPTAANEALVELTRFGKNVLSEEEAQPVIQVYLARHFGPAYRVLEKEHGKIPMSLALNAQLPFHPENARYIPIGTAAGAVKATTGYAFKTMCHHAHSLVEAMMQGKALPTPYQNSRFTFYDKLLLHILLDTPAEGKTIFAQLFKKVSPGKIYQFLDGHTTVLEDIPLLLSLPSRTFIKAFWEVYLLKPASAWFRQRTDPAYGPVAIP